MKQLAIDPSAFIVAIDACLGQKRFDRSIALPTMVLFIPAKLSEKNCRLSVTCPLKGLLIFLDSWNKLSCKAPGLHLPFEMSRVISRSLQLAYGRFQQKV